MTRIIAHFISARLGHKISLHKGITWMMFMNALSHKKEI